jgi:hypothetical protein
VGKPAIQSTEGRGQNRQTNQGKGQNRENGKTSAWLATA